MEICQMTERLVRCEEAIKQILAQWNEDRQNSQRQLASLTSRLDQLQNKQSDS